MDRRLTLANDRIAEIGLRGEVDAPTYAELVAAEVAVPLVDLLSAPDGTRDRQVLLGDGFGVLERRDGFAFGRAAKDGYCGYLPEAALGPPTGVTHWVAASATHLYDAPKVQARNLAALGFGARLRVTGREGAFAGTPHGFVPARHLRPLGHWFDDPVAVAGLFLGVPYLWGGNGHGGIDCSGLVQAAHLGCGIACPGDSDMQRGAGEATGDDAPPRRGDLLFWKGHVAMMVDGDRMIHATGHSMAVVVEPAAEAIARIASEGLEVIARRRLLPKAS